MVVEQNRIASVVTPSHFINTHHLEKSHRAVRVFWGAQVPRLQPSAARRQLFGFYLSSERFRRVAESRSRTGIAGEAPALSRLTTHTAIGALIDGCGL